MKLPGSKFAEIVQTPVFPPAQHQFRSPPKPSQRDNIFSQSRDLREDRGTREMKTTQREQTQSPGH